MCLLFSLLSPLLPALIQLAGSAPSLFLSGFSFAFLRASRLRSLWCPFEICWPATFRTYHSSTTATTRIDATLSGFLANETDHAVHLFPLTSLIWQERKPSWGESSWLAIPSGMRDKKGIETCRVNFVVLDTFSVLQLIISNQLFKDNCLRLKSRKDIRLRESEGCRKCRTRSVKDQRCIGEKFYLQSFSVDLNFLDSLSYFLFLYLFST